MGKKFLISQMIEDEQGIEKEQFYTLVGDAEFIYIGDSLNWDLAFDKGWLNKLRNDKFKMLRKGRLYVNESELDYARVLYNTGYVRNTSVNQALAMDYNKLPLLGPLFVLNNDVRTYGYYGVAFTFNTTTPDDDYYKVIKDVYIPNPVPSSIINRDFANTLSCSAGFESVLGLNQIGAKEINAEDENIIWIKHKTGQFEKISVFTVRIKAGSKLPVNMDIQVYEDDQWKTVLSHKFLTVKAFEKRIYDTNYTVKEVRWVFRYDSADTHNDSTKLIIENLNFDGSIIGPKIVPCALKDLKHEDMIPITEQQMRQNNQNGGYGIVNTNYDNLYYNRNMNGKINWLVSEKIMLYDSNYTQYWTAIGYAIKANNAPTLTNIIASNKGPDSYTHIHKEDVVVSFDLNDIDEDIVGYRVYINNINEESKIQDIYNLEANLNRSILVENKYFTSMDDAGSAYTGLHIIPYDSRGTTGGDYVIWVYKQNKIPTIVSTMFENKFTVTVTDPEKDLVSCKLSVNGFEFAEFSLKESPATYSFIVPSTKVLIGKENTITMIASDDTPGEKRTVTATHKFIGAHYGLLFTDENEEVLTTEFDDILKKIDFGTIITGMTSFAQHVKVLNKTGVDIDFVDIKSTINDNPLEEYKIEFDTIEDFDNPQPTLRINNIKNGDKVSFYVRVASKFLSAKPQSAEFDVVGKSSN